MMTIENIKEALSIRFVELIAASKGYKTSSVYPDNGTDLSIIEVDYRTENAKKRYFDTGREIKIQLKATSESSINENDDIIKYDLETKTYNDLISRMETRYPLILILFVLPTQISDWINISDHELIARKCAYWFFPEEVEQLTTNATRKRIKINKENILNDDTIPYLFERYA